jgi:hypothetical protein
LAAPEGTQSFVFGRIFELQQQKETGKEKRVDSKI